MATKLYLAIDLQPGIELGAKSPLHMTLTPPVRPETDVVPVIREGLQEKLRGFGSVAILGTEEAYFGPDSDPVRVRKIQRTDQLLRLHDIAMAQMQALFPDIDTTYTGERWQPHATYKDELGLGQDEMRNINQVTILRKVADAWDRAAVISLEGE